MSMAFDPTDALQKAHVSANGTIPVQKQKSI
jgi:hypothetical protein